MPPVITIQPMGGLGNRMRSMASALELGSQVGAEVAVLWERAPELNCRFRLLFQPLDGTRVRETHHRINKVAWRVRRALKVYSRVVREGDVRAWKRDREDWRQLADERSVLIQTQQAFGPKPLRLERFVPLDRLRASIDETTAAFTPHTVGVHIRRGDHPHAPRRSPTEDFIARMRGEIEFEPKTSFFLATDALDEEAVLKKEFGERIMARSHCLDRANPACVQDALIEMYALARTRKIFGSFYSSFSQTAAALGAVELEILDRGTEGENDRA